MISKNIRLIVTNQFLTALSDSIFMVTIMWYIYELTDSAFSTSLIMTISALTSIFIGPFVGVLVDRTEPKSSMQIGYGLMILIGIGLSAVYLISIDVLIFFIYATLILHLICMAFIYPAKSKLLPRIVGMKRIVKVNGFISSTSQTGELLGQALSGFLISLFGFIGVMLFHSGLYIIASFLLLFVVNISLPRENTTAQSNKQSSILTELRSGFRILKANRPVLKLFFLATLLNVTTIAGALLVVLVSDQYGATAIQFGFFNAAGALTGIVIGFFAEKLTDFAKPRIVFALMLGIAACAFIGMGSTANFYLGTTFYICMVASSIIFNILQNSLMIVLIEDRYRGRLLTLQAAISSMLIPLFSIAGGVVADLFHVNYLFLFAGIWMCLCALFPLLDSDFKKIGKISS